MPAMRLTTLFRAVAACAAVSVACAGGPSMTHVTPDGAVYFPVVNGRNAEPVSLMPPPPSEPLLRQRFYMFGVNSTFVAAGPMRYCTLDMTCYAATGAALRLPLEALSEGMWELKKDAELARKDAAQYQGHAFRSTICLLGGEMLNIPNDLNSGVHGVDTVVCSTDGGERWRVLPDALPLPVRGATVVADHSHLWLVGGVVTNATASSDPWDACAPLMRARLCEGQVPCDWEVVASAINMPWGCRHSMVAAYVRNATLLDVWSHTSSAEDDAPAINASSLPLFYLAGGARVHPLGADSTTGPHSSGGPWLTRDMTAPGATWMRPDNPYPHTPAISNSTELSRWEASWLLSGSDSFATLAESPYFTTNSTLSAAEYLLAMGARDAWISIDAGLTWISVSEQAAGNPGELVDPRYHPYQGQPLLAAAFSYEPKDNSPFAILYGDKVTFAYTRPCATRLCPSGTFATGCSGTYWSPICAPCTVCRQGVETEVRPCSSGNMLSTSGNAICQLCRTCGSNESVVAACTLESNTLCGPLPPPGMFPGSHQPLVSPMGLRVCNIMFVCALLAGVGASLLHACVGVQRRWLSAASRTQGSAFFALLSLLVLARGVQLIWAAAPDSSLAVPQQQLLSLAARVTVIAVAGAAAVCAIALAVRWLRLAAAVVTPAPHKLHMVAVVAAGVVHPLAALLVFARVLGRPTLLGGSAVVALGVGTLTDIAALMPIVVTAWNSITELSLPDNVTLAAVCMSLISMLACVVMGVSLWLGSVGAAASSFFLLSPSKHTLSASPTNSEAAGGVWPNGHSANSSPRQLSPVVAWGLGAQSASESHSASGSSATGTPRDTPRLHLSPLHAQAVAAAIGGAQPRIAVVEAFGLPVSESPVPLLAPRPIRLAPGPGPGPAAHRSAFRPAHTQEQQLQQPPMQPQQQQVINPLAQYAAQAMLPTAVSSAPPAAAAAAAAAAPLSFGRSAMSPPALPPSLPPAGPPAHSSWLQPSAASPSMSSLSDWRAVSARLSDVSGLGFASPDLSMASSVAGSRYSHAHSFAAPLDDSLVQEAVEEDSAEGEGEAEAEEVAEVALGSADSSMVAAAAAPAPAPAAAAAVVAAAVAAITGAVVAPAPPALQQPTSASAPASAAGGVSLDPTG